MMQFTPFAPTGNTRPGIPAGRRLLSSAALALAMMAGGLAAFALPTTGMAQEGGTQVAQPATININKADAATLASALRGVGMSRAEEIVRYRETYGAFESVDELLDVKGIGPATLDSNRALITLE